MRAKRKTIYNFPVLIEKDQGGYYIGTVPSLRSCYTQAKTLPELYTRLQEVISLCLEVEKEFFNHRTSQNKFIGVQTVEVVK
jgi:predicted RNase H-like HicB family nuclease